MTAWFRRKNQESTLLLCFRPWAEYATFKQKLQIQHNRLTADHKGELEQISRAWNYTRDKVADALAHGFRVAYADSVLHAVVAYWRRLIEGVRFEKEARRYVRKQDDLLEQVKVRSTRVCTRVADLARSYFLRAAFDSWGQWCTRALTRSRAVKELTFLEAEAEKRVTEAEMKTVRLEASLTWSHRREVSSRVESVVLFSKRGEDFGSMVKAFHAWRSDVKLILQRRFAEEQLEESARELEHSTDWLTSTVNSKVHRASLRLAALRTESERMALLALCYRCWTESWLSFCLEQGLLAQRAQHDEDCWLLTQRIAESRRDGNHRLLLLRVFGVWHEVFRKERDLRLVAAAAEGLRSFESGEKVRKVPSKTLLLKKLTDRALTVELAFCFRSWVGLARTWVQEREFEKSTAQLHARGHDEALRLNLQVREAYSYGLARLVVARWQFAARDRRATTQRQLADERHHEALKAQASRLLATVDVRLDRLVGGVHRLIESRQRRALAFRAWRCYHIVEKSASSQVALREELDKLHEEYTHVVFEMKSERKSAMGSLMGLVSARNDVAAGVIAALWQAWREQVMLRVMSHRTELKRQLKEAKQLGTLKVSRSVLAFSIDPRHWSMLHCLKGWVTALKEAGMEAKLSEMAKEVKEIEKQTQQVERGKLLKSLTRSCDGLHLKMQLAVVEALMLVWRRFCIINLLSRERGDRQAERKRAIMELEKETEHLSAVVGKLTMKTCRSVLRVVVQRCFAVFRQEVALRYAAHRLRSRVDETYAEGEAVETQLRRALRMHGRVTADFGIASESLRGDYASIRSVWCAWLNLWEHSRAHAYHLWQLQTLKDNHEKATIKWKMLDEAADKRLDKAFSMLQITNVSGFLVAALSGWRAVMRRAKAERAYISAKTEAADALENLRAQMSRSRQRTLERVLNMLTPAQNMAALRYVWFVWFELVCTVRTYRQNRQHIRALEEERVCHTYPKRMVANLLLECLLAWQSTVGATRALNRLPLSWFVDSLQRIYHRKLTSAFVKLAANALPRALIAGTLEGDVLPWAKAAAGVSPLPLPTATAAAKAAPVQRAVSPTKLEPHGTYGGGVHESVGWVSQAELAGAPPLAVAQSPQSGSRSPRTESLTPRKSPRTGAPLPIRPNVAATLERIAAARRIIASVGDDNLDERAI